MKTKLATCALIAWVLGCALIASARWNWLGELAVHFQPYLAVAGLGVAGAQLLVKRKRLALLMTVVCLGLFAPMLRFLPFGSAPPHVGSTLSVATLNLHRDRPANLNLDAWLERHDADVIAFQEVTQATARALRKKLAGLGQVELLPPDESTWTHRTYGQVLFCRPPIKSLSLVHEGWVGPGFFEVEIDVDGHELLIIACHPMRPGKADMTAARNATLSSIAERARQSARCIVLGDLNTTSFSPAFADLLNSGELQDSRVNIGWQPSFAPLEILPLEIPMLALDHVLVGRELVVLDRERTENVGSDHWPIIATIGFAEGRSVEGD